MAEVERTISSAELTEWAAYDCINPFGDVRAELHAAAIMAAIANFAGKSLVQGESVAVADMMLVSRPPKLSDEAKAWSKLPGVELKVVTDE